TAPSIRPPLRRRQARRVRARLRGPRTAREPPSSRPRPPARPLRGALPPRARRRVPGHEPTPARTARADRRTRPVRSRRRAAVDLRLPPRRRTPLPRPAHRDGATRRNRHTRDELPQPRSAPPRLQPSLRTVLRLELHAAERGAESHRTLPPRHYGPPHRAADSRPRRRLGESATHPAGRRPPSPALAPRRGPPARRPHPGADRRRPPAGRDRAAAARDRGPGRLRARARRA